MTAKKTRPAVGASESDAQEAEAPTSPARARRGGKGTKPADTATPARKPRQKPAVADNGARAARKPLGAKERKLRSGTKQEQLIAMLRRPEGVTVEEAAKAFTWERHTVRGALYGALKNKLGLAIVSEKVEGRGRVYRIGS